MTYSISNSLTDTQLLNGLVNQQIEVTKTIIEKNDTKCKTITKTLAIHNKLALFE